MISCSHSRLRVPIILLSSILVSFSVSFVKITYRNFSRAISKILSSENPGNVTKALRSLEARNETPIYIVISDVHMRNNAKPLI